MLKLMLGTLGLVLAMALPALAGDCGCVHEGDTCKSAPKDECGCKDCAAPVEDCGCQSKRKSTCGPGVECCPGEPLTLCCEREEFKLLCKKPEVRKEKGCGCKKCKPVKKHSSCGCGEDW